MTRLGINESASFRGCASDLRDTILTSLTKAHALCAQKTRKMINYFPLSTKGCVQCDELRLIIFLTVIFSLINPIKAYS